eukprot:7311303-Pyramimonas_sp.AAC.1
MSHRRLVVGKGAQLAVYTRERIFRSLCKQRESFTPGRRMLTWSREVNFGTKVTACENVTIIRNGEKTEKLFAPFLFSCPSLTFSDRTSSRTSF